MTLVLASGCAERHAITGEHAIAISKKEIQKRNWEGATVVSVNFSNQTWTVDLDRAPSSFGGHATVVVNAAGKVIEYVPGL